MARPQTKKDLVEAADLNYDKLLKMIDSMTEVELNTEFDFSADPKKKEAHLSSLKNHTKKLWKLFKPCQMKNYFKKMYMTG